MSIKCEVGVAKLDPKGRISVPFRVRRELGWKPGDILFVMCTDAAVTMRRMVAGEAVSRVAPRGKVPAKQGQ